VGYEMLVGLQVIDDLLYQEYRDAMTPILARYNGGFGYDFRVAEVLHTKTDAPINRVFTISFGDEAMKHQFFSDRAYQEVRARYFEPSVTHSTILAEYKTP
jgi:uncharacterized protein (DUF1330 family)